MVEVMIERREFSSKILKKPRRMSTCAWHTEPSCVRAHPSERHGTGESDDEEAGMWGERGRGESGSEGAGRRRESARGGWECTGRMGGARVPD